MKFFLRASRALHSVLNNGYASKLFQCHSRSVGAPPSNFRTAVQTASSNCAGGCLPPVHGAADWCLFLYPLTSTRSCSLTHKRLARQDTRAHPTSFLPLHFLTSFSSTQRYRAAKRTPCKCVRPQTGLGAYGDSTCSLAQELWPPRGRTGDGSDKTAPGQYFPFQSPRLLRRAHSSMHGIAPRRTSEAC